MKKIAIIGIGGRTGTLFAQEMKANNFVFGVGREREIEEIRKSNLFLQTNKESREVFKGEVIKEFEFQKTSIPDAIFLCTKNPVGPAVKYYYQIMKEKGGKMPTLFLSQNGIVAGDEAKAVLREIFNKEAEKIQIVRISLFNPVDKTTIDDKTYISYFLPIRLSFGIISGSKETKEIKEVFKRAGIEAEEVLPQDVKKMEFSKLFTNLIGMPSSIRGLVTKEGFKDPEIFKEEIEALREYIRVVKASKSNFLNLKRAPIKLFATLIYCLPFSILLPFRKQLGRLIDKGRGGKLKGNLDEVDYYNGTVVKLGKEIGISTPVNEKVLKRVKEILKT